MLHSRLSLRASAVFLTIAMASLVAEPAFAQVGPSGNRPPPGAPPGGPGGARAKPPKLPTVKARDIEQAAQEMFVEADLNHDGLATRAELDSIIEIRRNEAIVNRFQKIDADGNKQLDYSEFYSWQTTLGAGAHREKSSGVFQMISSPPAVAVPQGKSEKARFVSMLLKPVTTIMLVQADRNYDGGVDRDEFVAAQLHDFRNADTNNDGELEAIELRELLETRRSSVSCVVVDQLPPDRENGRGAGPPPPPHCRSE